MWKCSPKISFTNQSTCLHFYWPMISLCALVCQAKGCPHYTAKLVLIIHLPYFNLTYHYKGGGSFGPQSYFQLIWTQWTIIDKFIVKGVNKWSCTFFFLGRLPELHQFSSMRKILQNLEEIKYQSFFSQLKWR